MDSRQKYEKEKVLFAITLCSVQVLITGKCEKYVVRI